MWSNEKTTQRYRGIIFKRILNDTGPECVDWIAVRQNSVQWWDFLSTVIIFRVT